MLYHAKEGLKLVRIIVTGGAGFIGSHIVDAYVALDHDVLVVDSLWDHGGGRRENVNARAQFYEVDIRDASIARIFEEFKPDIISHHAAQHSVAISSRDPLYDADVNIRGFLNVLESCVKAGARKVIFAGSGASFGDVEHLPITEKTPQIPTSPYGITKMAAEHYLRFFKYERGLDFTSLRYGNVYGPRQDPNGEAGVISIFIGKFLQNQGVRIDSDGNQTRDYVFVKDIAQANAAALEHGAGGCYVIGTNKRTSVNEVYRSLVEITGFKAPITHAPRRPGDALDAQLDPALAKAELGWAPQTPLLEGMRATYMYFQGLLRG